ncbi:uncharacterized protein NPIL_597191 [Nephila pilipes]|uniref:Integrase zinc-binding domain-containing protein n=1 Tax=Nephila pilipes TaxID=299642 RepID=A0A8X6Q1Q5_NEPPI|nr:uncharacterized protein NPIL_597191 [Nephila pilipes]
MNDLEAANKELNWIKEMNEFYLRENTKLKCYIKQLKGMLFEFGNKLEDAGLLTDEQKKKFRKECAKEFLSYEEKKDSCKDSNNIHAPSTERLNPSCTYSKDIGGECSDMHNNDSPIESSDDEILKSTSVFADSYQKELLNNQKTVLSKPFSRNKKNGDFKQSTYPYSFSDTLSSEKEIVSTEELFQMQLPSFRQSYIHKDKEISFIKDHSISTSSIEPFPDINKPSTYKPKLHSKETSYSVNSPVKDIYQTLNTSIPVFSNSHGSDTDTQFISVPHIMMPSEKTPKRIKKCSDFFSEVSQRFEESENNSKIQSSPPKLSDCGSNATNSKSVRQNNLTKTVSNSENISKGTNKNYVLSAKRCHDGSVKLDIDISRPFKLTLNPTNCQMSCEFDPIENPFHNTSNPIKNSNSSSTVLQNELVFTEEFNREDCSINKSPFKEKQKETQRVKHRKNEFTDVPKCISKMRKRQLSDYEFDFEEMENKMIISPEFYSGKSSTPFQRGNLAFLNKTLVSSPVKEKCSEFSNSDQENSPVKNIHSPITISSPNETDFNSLITPSVFKNENNVISSQNSYDCVKKKHVSSCSMQAFQRDFSYTENVNFPSKISSKNKIKIHNKVSRTLLKRARKILRNQKFSSKLDDKSELQGKVKRHSLFIKKNKYLKKIINPKLKKMQRRCIRKTPFVQYASQIFTDSIKIHKRNKLKRKKEISQKTNASNTMMHSVIEKVPSKKLITKSKMRVKAISNEVGKMKMNVLLKPLKDPLLYNELPSKILQNNKSTPFKNETGIEGITLKQCSVLLERLQLNRENLLDCIHTDKNKILHLEDYFSALDEKSSSYLEHSRRIKEDSITEDAVNGFSKHITNTFPENDSLNDCDTILINEIHNSHSEHTVSNLVSEKSLAYNDTEKNTQKNLCLDFDIDFDSDIELFSDDNDTDFNCKNYHTNDDSEVKPCFKENVLVKASKKDIARFSPSENSVDVSTDSESDLLCDKKIKNRQNMYLDFDINFNNGVQLLSDENNSVSLSDKKIETSKETMLTENAVTNFSETGLNTVMTYKTNPTPNDKSLSFSENLSLEFDIDPECILNLASHNSDSVHLNENSGKTCSISLNEPKDIPLKNSEAGNTVINFSGNKTFISESNITNVEKSISVPKNLCLDFDGSSDTNWELVSGDDNSVNLICKDLEKNKIGCYQKSIYSDDIIKLCSENGNSLDFKGKINGSCHNSKIKSCHSENDGVTELGFLNVPLEEKTSETLCSLKLEKEISFVSLKQLDLKEILKPCFVSLERIKIPLESRTGTVRSNLKNVSLVEERNCLLGQKGGIVTEEEIFIETSILKQQQNGQVEDMLNVSPVSSRNSAVVLSNQIFDLDDKISDQGEKLPLCFDCESDDDRELVIDEDISENIDDNGIKNDPEKETPIENKIFDFGNSTDFFVLKKKSSACTAKFEKWNSNIGRKSTTNDASSKNSNLIVIHNDEDITCDDKILNEENSYGYNSYSDNVELTIDDSINEEKIEHSTKEISHGDLKDQTSDSDCKNRSLIPKEMISSIDLLVPNTGQEFEVLKEQKEINNKNTSSSSSETNQFSIAEKNKLFKKNATIETAKIPKVQVNSNIKLNRVLATNKSKITSFKSSSKIFSKNSIAYDNSTHKKNISNNNGLVTSKSVVNNIRQKYSRATFKKGKFQNQNCIRNKYLKKTRNIKLPFSDPINNILHDIETINISSEHSKQKFRVFISNLCFKNYVRLLNVYLSNPNNASDKASLIFKVIYYLLHTRKNPFFDIKGNKELSLFLPLAENCVVTVLFIIEKKSKPYLSKLMEDILHTMYLLILTKKKTNIYGLASLCRVFTEICKRKDDKLKPLLICCDLLKEKNMFSPFLIASIAGVWKELFQMSNDLSDEEIVLRGSIAYGVQKMIEISVVCTWYCNSEFILEHFAIPNNASDMNETVKVLKEKILLECSQDATDDSWKLTSPLVVFAAFGSWAWTKKHLIDNYILPNLHQFSCKNLSERAFDLFCNLYVDILLLYPEELPVEVIVKFFDSNPLFEGVHFVQDCAAVALMKYFVSSKNVIPDKLSLWFQNNQDNPKDIQCVMKGGKLSNASKLLNLSPFLDEKNVLRVGGRLQHSELPLNHKHPMLIPNNCNICDLVIDHYHVFYLHTGVEATLDNLRTQFWVTNGRSTVKRALNKCLKCLKKANLCGWIACGKLKERQIDKQGQCFLLNNDSIQDTLKLFFDLEGLGIRDDPVLHERDQALEILKKTVEFENGRYIVQLPFRKSYNELSENYSLAKQRFQNLRRRFGHDSELYQQYCEILDYTEQGIIEEVKTETTDNELKRPVYYLPH